MVALPSFAQHVVISRGKDEPMDQETVLHVTLPIKINIDAIKKAQATERQVFECLEFSRSASELHQMLAISPLIAAKSCLKSAV